MSKKSLVFEKPIVEPLFSDLDRRELMSLSEVSKKTGYPSSTLRIYAMNGTIPGGRQATKGKRWYFKRTELEAWWRQFNAGVESQVN